MSQQIAFSFDISRCSGCMACTVACMDQNDLPGEGPSFRQVTKLEKTGPYSGRISFVSLACFHCSDAPCLEVCPKNALFREPEMGVVDVSEDLCIGCRACAMVCPFGAPQFRSGEKMTKCNFCIERIGIGMEPACVRVCPTKALGCGSTEELSQIKTEKASLKIFNSLESVGI